MKISRFTFMLHLLGPGVPCTYPAGLQSTNGGDYGLVAVVLLLRLGSRVGLGGGAVHLRHRAPYAVCGLSSDSLGLTINIVGRDA